MALLQQGAQQLVPKIRHRLDEARLHALRAQKPLRSFSGSVALHLLLAVKREANSVAMLSTAPYLTC